jgi:Zn-dependent protease with chaperone function/type II secretory pathway pseudopilin PulG
MQTDPWVYPRERTLGALTLVLGVLVWLLLVLGTFGIALVYVLLGFVGYCFAQSAVIAWIKGTAVKLSPGQLPELHARFSACCARLDVEKPEAYLLHGNGAFNAFATRFFGRNFVVLLSDVVDALEQKPDGINFYIGHELGHIRRGHLTGAIWRAPVLWLPLLGAAYSRAKEYTCDRHGAACCEDPESAPRALAALAAGAQQWRHVDLQRYADQSAGKAGFWVSFHELIGGYPWLTKRVGRVIDPAAPAPGRSALAHVLALFVPYGGRAGGGAAGTVMVVAVIGILAAVALPAYQNYVLRAGVNQAWTGAEPVRQALGRYYLQKRALPASLSEAGAPQALPDGTRLSLNASTMVLDARTRWGTLRMEPAAAGGGGVEWHCLAGEGLPPMALPAFCKK